MTDTEAIDTEHSQVQVAALLYLLSRKPNVAADAKLTRMALDHLDILAADPSVSPVIRATCRGIARQWRAAGGLATSPGDSCGTSLH